MSRDDTWAPVCLSKIDSPSNDCLNILVRIKVAEEPTHQPHGIRRAMLQLWWKILEEKKSRKEANSHIWEAVILLDFKHISRINEFND